MQQDEAIDQKVRAYFAHQAMPEESVKRILELGRKQPRRPSLVQRYWIPLAAAACIAVVFAFQFSPASASTDFASDVAGEIALRHNAARPMDADARSFEDVQDGLQDLGFSVTPLKHQKLLSAYEIMGCRYCQVQGQQAAQLKVRHRVSGALYSLYVVAMNGPLKALAGVEKGIDLEANHVDMWQDSGRLYALVN